ncbi:olfactory receptor 5V1-like [Bombina bombina]|uniref:olfactory receptor 5V1-like n=1 Tax=Bombina bombina TaxID=8345 RepID=UPI00235A895C|nr:olfactory receptor 5V1-like [Bombina bombina]
MEIIVLGFYECPDLQLILFMMFLLMYLVALLGNLTILTVIFTIPHLHTPMYYFLCNLSVLDITFISTVLPKLLDICLTGNQSITYTGCFTQMFFTIICVDAEYSLLASMAYDRYSAICHPLRYPYLMNASLCVYLALVSWCIGFMESFMFLGMISQKYFCGPRVINHLFCELRPLIELSCTGTQDTDLAIKITGVLFGFVPFAFIIMSYIFIISSILCIRSNDGKRKAFSTCSSHLTVVILFFVTILGVYMRPKSTNSIKLDKVFAVLYTSCIPMFNPIIYSLRNKEVKQAVYQMRNHIVNKMGLI